MASVIVKTEHAKRKHWVVSGDSGDRGINRNVKDWVNIYQNGIGEKPNYDQIYDFGKHGFSKVGPKDVIYIHCHGGFRYINKENHGLGFVKDENGEDQQFLWIKEKNGTRNPNGVTPKEFAQYLIDNALDSKHEVLKIAACNSDRFAKEVHKELKTKYPNLTIYGYKNELVVCQGKTGGKIAGLVAPFVAERSGHSQLVEEAFTEHGKSKDDFKASKYRVGYGPQAQVEHVAQSVAAPSHSVAAAAASAAPPPPPPQPPEVPAPATPPLSAILSASISDFPTQQEQLTVLQAQFAYLQLSGSSVPLNASLEQSRQLSGQQPILRSYDNQQSAEEQLHEPHVNAPASDPSLASEQPQQEGEEQSSSRIGRP